MTDLFEKPADQSGNAPAEAPESGDLLGSLVGDGKKYKTPEDLAKSRVEADKFIEQLKEENAGMRAKLKELEESEVRGRTVQEVLDAMQGNSNEEEGNQSRITEEDIRKLVDGRVSEVERQRAARANREQSNAEVLKRFNNDAAKAREFMASEARRLGVALERLGEIAEQSPAAFTRILGLDGSKSAPPTFRSEGGVSTGDGTIRNAAYYDKLKKELGSRFYEPRIQQQRFADRQRLGEDFFK